MIQVPVDIRQDKIELLLSSLKVAESHFTVTQQWEAAKQVGKLNTSLRKQIFSFTRVEDE